MIHQPRAVFVTGTDTGVGKTFVASLLAHALVQQGLRTAVMKPIASGAERTAAGLRSRDALSLMAESNLGAAYRTVNPYCFEPAIAPHIAAAEAGVTIELRVIRERFEELAQEADAIVIEGAGGWHAPLDDSCTMAEVPAVLNVPVLLVVGLRLGCLNHALLTREAIDARGVSFAGWVANDPGTGLQRCEANLATLERLLGSAALAVLPFEPPPATLLRAGAALARSLACKGLT